MNLIISRVLFSLVFGLFVDYFAKLIPHLRNPDKSSHRLVQNQRQMFTKEVKSVGLMRERNKPNRTDSEKREKKVTLPFRKMSFRISFH